MTKTRTTVLAGAVWMTALLSSGAFAYVMHRPPTVQPPKTTAALQLVRVEPVAPPAVEPQPQHFVLPTIEIVSHIARPVAPQLRTAAPPPPVEPKARELHCRPFKPLEQGTGGVQVCD